MLKITARDRIFAAVALPAALLALYVLAIRPPLAGRIDAMEARLATLGAADELEGARPALRRRLETALAGREKAEGDELARQESASGGVEGGANRLDAPARLQHAIALFEKTRGLRVVSTERIDGGEAPHAPLVRDAISPNEPTFWRFTVSAGYGMLVEALGNARDANLAAVVESVETGAKGARPGSGVRIWKIAICL